MKIKIYQIEMDRDTNRVCFLGYNSLEKFQGSAEIDTGIYDLVWDGTVDASDLEDVYRIFNVGEKPKGYKGRSLSVSDIVVTKDGAYFCDSFGFVKVDFGKEG